MAIDDPIVAGLARGWKVHGGPHGALPPRLACDVAIVGTGAGAGITAELLCKAGLSVVLVEEGPLKSSRDFRQLESEAYPALYQESASRQTATKWPSRTADREHRRVCSVSCATSPTTKPSSASTG